MVARDTSGELEFRFFSPQSRQVYLVGDFNNWQVGTLPMTRSPDGEWVCHLGLPAGVYEFKYFADGEWCVDRAQFGVGWAPFGCNSVTVVSGGDCPAFPVG